MTEVLPAIHETKRSSKLRITGFAAFGVCVIGYLGFLACVIAIKSGTMSVGAGIAVAGVFAVAGEVGLWVGAACLGLGIYTRRREKLSRFFGKIKSSFAAKG